MCHRRGCSKVFGQPFCLYNHFIVNKLTCFIEFVFISLYLKIKSIYFLALGVEKTALNALIYKILLLFQQTLNKSHDKAVDDVNKYRIFINCVLNFIDLEAFEDVRGQIVA